MPNRNYLIGYRFEIRCRKKLESLGWWVARQGKSAFPDLICLKKGESFLGECKASKKRLQNPVKYLNPVEYEMALQLVRRTGLPFYLFYKTGRRIKVLAIGGVGVFKASDLELLMR